VLALTGVHVNYGPVAALRGLDLRVDRGEVVGAIGRNGAGKSTMIGVITGTVRPAAGQIMFLDQPLVGPPEAIALRGIALVPEGRRLFTKLTVEENLLVGTTVREGRRQARQRLDPVLSYFPDLRRYLNVSAGRLSGGEQQMVAIGRALMCQPELLVLDEPSLGLAPLIVDRLFSVLQDLNRDGVTILLVEQNALRTLDVANRVYVMEGGQVQLEGAPADIKTRPELLELYVGTMVT
jgi:branched-chain amino acid transport system ATP-binding protein